MQFDYTKIFDISWPIGEKTAVYPGNPPVKIESIKSQASGSLISKLTLGTHTGTHIDAPLHALEQGKTITDLSLANFIGPCRVLDVTNVRNAIQISDLESFSIQKDERILLKTKNSDLGFTTFNPNYVYVTPEAAKYLSQKQITLLGIDYLSVKQKGLPDNIAHTALLSQNIPILEGINLQEVAEVNYLLICFPLKLTGLDGSPCRAVLLKLGFNEKQV